MINGFLEKPAAGWRILAVCAGILVALVINELVLSFILPSYNPRAQVKFIDPDGPGPRPVTGEPNTSARQAKNTGDYDVSIQINAHGFRDSKDISTATRSDYVMVGDSFIFGWGIEERDRISNVLEKILGNRIFNIGITGNLLTYQALIDYAGDIGANIGHLIICVTMENDLDRYAAELPQVAPSNQAAPSAASANFLERVKTALMMKSTLYFATTAVVHQIPWLESIAVRLGVVTPNLEGIHQTLDFDAIDPSARKLADMASRYETTIVLIPSRAMWYGNERDDASAIHQAFASQLDALGLNVVDLRPVFEHEEAPLSYHFRNDGHWNPSGHKLAAEVLALHFNLGR